MPWSRPRRATPGTARATAPEIDKIGNRNLADAASRAGVRRFVLTSILTCDQTPEVPHFWHKKLAEDRLEELGVPFVALRPGAFLDQVTQMGGDPFAKGRLMWFGSPHDPADFRPHRGPRRLPRRRGRRPGVDGQRIDIGWDRPVSMQERRRTSRAGCSAGTIRVRTIPVGRSTARPGGCRPVRPDGQGHDRDDSLVPDRPVRRRPDPPARGLRSPYPPRRTP